MRCGNFFHSSACCAARMATRGSGPCPAMSRYTASSISNHSARQAFMRVHSQNEKLERLDQIPCTCGKKADRSEMFQQVAKLGNDHQLAGAALQLVVFQNPGRGMRNEDGVQPRLQRRIDVAARAVADHPPV